MGSKTDYFENLVLEAVVKGSAGASAFATALSNITLGPYVALFSVAPTDNTTGTELTGNAYTRVQVPVANWTLNQDGAGGQTGYKYVSNNAVVTFPTATPSGWSAVVAFGICNSLAGALATSLLYWGTISPSVTINANEIGKFAVGALKIYEG